MKSSFFSEIPAAQPDRILGLAEDFKKDSHPNKVNLGIGVYQDSTGKIPILECVKKASALWLTSEDSKTYLPIDGVATYNSATQELVFGKGSQAVLDKRVATVQTVGGSGALRLGIEIIKQFFPTSAIYISDPSWDNHRSLFEGAGVAVKTYPYYSPSTNGVRVADMLSFLREIPSRSAVLLHACCHNPTGVDLDEKTWGEVLDICAERELIPFFDMAYQGFGSGLAEDAAPVRLGADRGLTFLVASSFAKSLSIYRERCGALSVVTGSPQEATHVLSQIKRIIRTIYSSPPSYGAQLVSLVLNTPELRNQWESELQEMRLRILEMRNLFARTLRELLPSRDFSFIEAQRGMFSYSGLPRETVLELREKFHIYALESGRICVAAMNDKNIDYICSSIAQVL